MEETQIKRSLDIFWNGRIVGRYDLVSTVFWPALASAPAMKIGGSDSINSILSGPQTSAALAMPQECECVLAIVRERAERLKTYLK